MLVPGRGTRGGFLRSGGAGLAFNPLSAGRANLTLQSPHGKSLMPSDGDTISFNPRAISK